MLRGSNAVIGAVNFATFLASIPVLAGGIWLGARAGTTECLRFLQWPLVAVGLALMVLSLAGFAGACYRVTWLLRLYLFATFVLILVLLAFVVFAFAVTDKGGGEAVLGRSYLEYRLRDYSGWLRDRVAEPRYWGGISACLRDAGACRRMARYARDPSTGVLVPETADMFYRRDLSPLQSGCCKPPTSCGFTYVNETTWNPAGSSFDDVDCTRWSNDRQLLCYGCDSCKAAVLATLRKRWRKVSIINIVVLIVLVLLFVIALAAYRNNRRRDNDEAFGVGRMTKARPSRFHF